MINFDSIPDLIRELKVSVITVKDVNENKLLKIDETNPEIAISKLIAKKEIFKNYGRVYITGQTTEAKKQTSTRGYNWEVSFTDANNKPIAAASVAQVNTNNDAMMKLELKLLKMELEQKFEKKEKELQEKHDSKMKFGIDPGWMPLIGKVMGMKKEEIVDLMQMTMIASNGVGEITKPSQISGTAQAERTAQLNVQMTPEEQQKIEQEMILGFQSLDQKIGSIKLLELVQTLNVTATKADTDKIIKLLTALNNNPSLVDTALTFIK